MQNIFIISFLAVGFYVLAKFVEIKFIKKGVPFRGIKEHVQETIVIFISTLIGSSFYFIFEKNIHEFFNVVTDNKNIVLDKVEIFTDTPNF